MYVCRGDPIVYLGGGVGEEENFYFSSTPTHVRCPSLAARRLSLWGIHLNSVGLI
jgi:hypothetical protein